MRRDWTSKTALLLVAAISFGVMFATFIILLIVPALYLAVDDVTRWSTWIFSDPEEGPEEATSAATGAGT